LFARIFFLTWLTYCGYYLCRKNFSVLMPYLKTEAGWTTAGLADVLFAYSLCYAVGQFVMGWLADRMGARRTVTLGSLVSAACSLATAPGLWLTPVQAVNGLAQASGWPGLLKMTRDWFPARSRGVVMAWWGTHLVVGGFVATNLAAFAARADWRRGAWVPAVVLMAISLVFAAGARDGAAHTTTATARGPLVLNAPLLAISAMYFCVKLLRYSFLFWLPLYLHEHLRYAPETAGYASSLFELVGFGGVLAAGYLSDYAARGARFPVGAAFMAALAGLCAAYPALSSFSPAANLLGIGLIGAFTFGPDTLMAGSATQEVVPPESTGSAGGFVNGVGSAGQVLSPYVVSWVSGRFGWDALFWVLAAIALAGAAILALAARWPVGAGSSRAPVESVS
jgi:sugar phosphate permease